MSANMENTIVVRAADIYPEFTTSLPAILKDHKVRRALSSKSYKRELVAARKEGSSLQRTVTAGVQARPTTRGIMRRSSAGMTGTGTGAGGGSMGGSGGSSY